MIDVEQLAKDSKLFDGRYKLLRTLSTDGGTADVWLAIDINTIDNPDLIGDDVEDNSFEETGMMVAIKIYRPQNALDIEGEQRFRDEYKIVHNCRHTNLLQPTNFSICDETPYLELPYCKNGSSEKLIGRKKDEKEIWKFILDVSSGLSYLHACTPQIIHQDIKPANVLIDDYGNYAITDFGISSQCGGKHGYYYEGNNSGTMAYMAPERFEEDYRPIPESDVWAFGATLYEILTGEVPYKENGGKNQLENKCPLKPMGNSIPKEVQKLINSCLSLDIKKRPTANQIIRLAEKKLNPSNGFAKYVIIAVLGILGGLYLLLSNTTQTKLGDDEIYQDALSLLNSDTKLNVQHGVRIMDSLARANYYPAMYEIVKTYGWYKDSVSLRRKQILGIECYSKGSQMYMPMNEEYNNIAKEYILKIIKSKETIAPEIRADVIYRNAIYSVNMNKKYVFERALKDMEKAKEWAKKANDTILLKNIRIGTENIKKELNEINKEIGNQ